MKLLFMPTRELFYCVNQARITRFAAWLLTNILMPAFQRFIAFGMALKR